MNRSGRRHALPLSVLVVVTVLDIALGRGQQILSLTVIAPLVAALLGVYDLQYTADARPSQLVRLVGIALGGGLALAACTLRLRAEARLREVSAQAAASRAVVQLAESLQRSLLGDPPAVPGLETAVRYRPATRHAQVGGDWYDAFPVPDGTTMLVIGDVAGHDAPAAATMSQTRGMLRAIAQFVVGSPAAVLAELDTTVTNLGLPTLVTATVATLDVRPDGSATLCWSNAGHPAPVLACADGTVVLLERRPDRLLGVGQDLSEGTRHDHAVNLQPGDAVVFYTDGLVERHRMLLDEGTAWLVGELRRIGREPLDRLCDDLLAVLGETIEDDVALLAVRLPAR